MAWIETPIGKQWIEDAKRNEDHDVSTLRYVHPDLAVIAFVLPTQFLHELELARLRILQLQGERISRSVPPFLPGSPAEWLWQVDQSAEMAVIISGLEEALSGSVYDAPQGRVSVTCSSFWRGSFPHLRDQSRSIPRPLTGSMMRDKFHQLYHVRVLFGEVSSPLISELSGISGALDMDH